MNNIRSIFLLGFIVIVICSCSESPSSILSSQGEIQKTASHKDIKANSEPKVTRTQPPEPTPSITTLPPTQTKIPPTLTKTPTPPGIELIPHADVEKAVTDRHSEPPVNIKKQVYFAGGAGGGGITSCVLPEDWSFPAIGDAGMRFSERHLCLLGFPEQELFISLYLPDGTLIGTKTLEAGSYDGSNRVMKNFYIDEYDGRLHAFNLFDPSDWTGDGDLYDSGLRFFSFWFPPLGYPTGEWVVAVEYGDEVLEYKLLVESRTAIGGISILSKPYFNPVEKNRREFLPGEVIYIFGTGYPPNSDVPVGIYYDSGGYISGTFNVVYDLVYGIIIGTDVKGQFWFPYEIHSDDLPGSYLALSLVDIPDDLTFSSLMGQSNTMGFTVEAVEDSQGVDPVFASTNTPTVESLGPPTATKLLLCPGVSDRKLGIGDKAVVKIFQLSGRSAPGYSNPKEHILAKGKVIEIIGGPECVDSSWWWLVHFSGKVSSGEYLDFQAWMPEVEGNKYYLIREP